MAAAHFGLGKLMALVDNNRLQTDGTIAEIMALSPLEDKWRAFGWGVRRVDGHELGQILDAVREAEAVSTKPQVIIADTTKGKGISYIENSVPWHSHPIDDEQLRLALQELDEASKEAVAR